MNEIRDKIWYFLVDAKTNQYYSKYIVKKYQIRDLWLNIFLAIATSSSIAAWAIWDIYLIIWILVIAISQVIMITKPYFLFPKYIKEFGDKCIRWQHLSLDIEKLWYRLNEEIIDKETGGDIYFELKEKSLSFDTLTDELIFFKHNKQLTSAENECEIYLTKI